MHILAWKMINQEECKYLFIDLFIKMLTTYWMPAENGQIIYALNWRQIWQSIHYLFAWNWFCKISVTEHPNVGVAFKGQSFFSALCAFICRSLF